MVAVGTATLWTLNYPLLLILQPLGNIWHWVIFIGWFLAVTAAAVSVFRSPVAEALQRARET